MDELPIVDGMDAPELHDPAGTVQVRDCHFPMPAPELEITDARTFVARLAAELQAGHVRIEDCCVTLTRTGVFVHPKHDE